MKSVVGHIFVARTGLERVPPGLCVALGGGAGSVIRFLLGGWVTTWAYAPFPWATFAVNLTGSALLGLIVRLLPAEPAAARWRAFLAIGFCGGFTTFSTFDLEMFTLLRDGRHLAAGGYALLSVGGCVAGIWGGYLAAGTMRAHTRPAG